MARAGCWSRPSGCSAMLPEWIRQRPRLSTCWWLRCSGSKARACKARCWSAPLERLFASSRRDSGHAAVGRSGARQGGIDAPEGRQCLPYHLIHVVIAVGCQPADEPNITRGERQCLISLVELLIFRARHWVIRIAGITREFVGDAGLRMNLAGEMLVFS